MRIVIWMAAVALFPACGERKADGNAETAKAAMPKSPPTPPPQAETSPPAPPPAERPIEITAERLLAEYKANEIRADDKYRDKLLRVSGRIKRIGKDALEQPMVVLGVGDFDSVIASFEREGDLASLMRGNPIAVRCRGHGMTLSSPVLVGCAIDLEQPIDPASFIPDPGASLHVTLDLQGNKPPPAAEQKAWIEAGVAVRNHCRQQRVKADKLGDLWNTAQFVVRRKGETFVVQANFDDRRKAVHRGRSPLVEVDAKLTRIHALNADARSLCDL